MEALTWFLGILFFVTLATFVVDLIISAPATPGLSSDHFDGKRFSNPDKVRARGIRDIVKWSVSGDRGPWTRFGEEHATFEEPGKSVVNPEEVVITFVNHSTFLLQSSGKNILTDPVWSERASPVRWAGPKRMRPPGIRFDNLPSIDLVLISHNHYDHLDLRTIARLNESFEPLFVVPLGVSRLLKENGIFNTVELDWWQQHEVDRQIAVTGVPARHFSGRGLTDRDKTLWCGFVLQLPGGNIYFAGDTGYDSFFKEINEQLGPIHTALLPIGAYRPRWFMSPIHVDPEEAVQIHMDLQARLSIGMHFGTFPMADDGMTEPVEELVRVREQMGLSERDFRTLEEGSSLSVPLPQNV